MVNYEAELSKLRLELVDTDFIKYRHSHNFRCLLCGSTFTSTLTQRKQAHHTHNSVGCPTCAKSSKLHPTLNRLTNDISKLNIAVNINNKNSVNVGGLTVVLIPLTQQNEKTQVTSLVAQPDTIVLFEDELTLKYDICYSKIIHKLQLNNYSTIYARQCEVVHLDVKTKNQFLNQFHIQQADKSLVKLGLKYKHNIVAVMTFSKPRVAVGAKTNNQVGVYELSRFATSSERVIGAASKLLTAFERQFNPVQVYSFADRRWSTGNLYFKLGFELTATNKPSYHYVINNTRKHRWAYRRDVISKTLPNFNSQLTEHQNMINHGYHFVWDAGTLKFSKNI